MRTVIIIIIVLLTMSIVGYLIETKPVVETVEGERALRAVVVIESEPIEVHRRTIGYGIADAIFHADVPARVSSLVKYVPPSARSGSSIRKGELIVELDTTDFAQRVIKAEQSIASANATQQSQLVERKSAEERARIAKEDFQLAELELKRISEAFENGAANQREIDIAKQKSLATESSAINAKELADKYPSLEEQTSSNIKSLEADLVMAQENLKRCSITSPIDGVLQDIDVRVGEHVVNGTRVARIVNTKVLEIPLRLPSYARSFVHIGDPVTLSSAGFGLRSWNSKISRIAPEDETKSRTMIAYVDLSQLSNNLNHIPPGLFLKAEVVDNYQPILRWVVPRRAIKEDRIMVVRDQVLHSIPVIAEFSIVGSFDQFKVPDEDWVVLQTQLEKGDLVAVDPGVSLRDGMNVRPISTSEVEIE